MSDIAAELRVSKKTLYRHFSSKEGLVRACVARVTGTIFPAVAAGVLRPGPVGERIEALLEALTLLPPLVSGVLVRDLEAEYPHLWEELDRRRHEAFEFVERAVEQGIAEGSLRPELHPKVVRALLKAVMEQVMVPEVLGLGEFGPDDAVRTLVTLVRGGLLMPPAESVGDAGGAAR